MKYLCKKVTCLKNISHEKVHPLTIDVNFADFWQENSVFMQKNYAFKNIIHEESLYFDNYWRISQILREKIVYLCKTKNKKQKHLTFKKYQNSSN